MNWSSRKIDYRNQLFGYMVYQIKCSFPGFFDAREWCWEHFGAGVEYEHYHNLETYSGRVSRWAWDCSKYQGASINNGKIYLASEEDMALFTLRWS